MSTLDDVLAEEEWSDSDHESLPQDRFNTMNVAQVAPLAPGQAPVPVNAGVNKVSYEPPPFDFQRTATTPAPKPSPVVRKIEQPRANTDPKMELAAKMEELEREELEEEREMAQAREIKKVNYVEPAVSRNVPSTQPAAKPVQSKQSFTGDGRFNGKYDQEVVDFFTRMNEKSITDQAIEYLNAYWDEVGDQAEFIFSVAHRIFREADMHRQGISLLYKYEEGSDVDYPTYLYFYEKLCKFVSKNPQWREGQYEKSAVYEVKTAIKHKNDLKEKVDVNFDGRISFLEFLLYQYNVFSNPTGFMERAKRAGEEHPAIIEARLALQKVNERIKAYEEERARLENGAALPGVKGLTFKHQLTMLDKSPLSEQLNEALITAEAAVRMAVKKFSTGTGSFVQGAGTPRGALWWMQRDLQEKKQVMIPRTLRRPKKNH